MVLEGVRTGGLARVQGKVESRHGHHRTHDAPDQVHMQVGEQPEVRD